MRRVRLEGIVEIIMDVPDCMTIEEIDNRFKEHCRDGKFYLKKIIVKENKK